MSEQIGHSLQTPSEHQKNGFKPLSNAPVLNNEETSNAMSSLYSHSFPKVERRYADPTDQHQKYALVSFTPSKGATPDEDGVFGMMKVRGVYQTLDEADEKAEWIVRNVDSMHSILTTFVGRPFPCIESANECGHEVKLNEIDINKKVEEVVRDDTKAKREDERKAYKEIKEREEKLKEDVKKDNSIEDMEDEERYIMERVKRSQLIYAYTEGLEKMRQMKESIIKGTDIINAFDQKDDTFKQNYMHRYREARSEAGLENDDTGDDTFIQYMGEIDLEKIFGEKI